MGNTDRSLNCIAFDCGNSSIRVVLGRYDGQKMSIEVIHQVENQALEINGLFYWDIIKIFAELQKGLQKAYTRCGRIDSVGVCTWGIDFGILEESGHLLLNPLSYRNTLGQEALSQLNSTEKQFTFNNSGIQNNRINSLYQLLGIRRVFPRVFELGESFLLIPDLLVYMFTGIKRTEFTIASTTQLIDVNKKDYSDEIIKYFKLPENIFPQMTGHGESYGFIKDSLAEALSINKFPFVCVPSHDTASAVASIPVREKDFLFISSGTWSLIGTELGKTIINETVYNLNFANEGGAFGTITFLKNSAGMHIIQQVRRELLLTGKDYSWEDMVDTAKQCSVDVPLINPNDDVFFNPPCMIQAIEDYFKCTNQQCDQSISTIIRSVYESMAYSYRNAVEETAKITGKNYNSIHIVGGGSKNNFLNQLTADITGKTVYAGPVEATSLGNLGIQLKYHNNGLDIKDIREIIGNSIELKEFRCQEMQGVDNKFIKYKSLL